MSSISINSIGHFFVTTAGRLPVLQGINLSVGERDVLAILGPSGCGKSTLLKIVAGLLLPTTGSIMIDSQPAASSLSKAKVGFAFQEPTLLPWRTVEENISLAKELSKGTKQIVTDRIDEVLKMVGLTEYRTFYPDQLSGGMKQRVGLARSMVLDPDILLLDEPLASLDLITRTQLMLELSSIFETLKLTILVVTHSIEEAVLWGTKIAVLSARPGRVVEEIAHPRSSHRDLAYMDSPQFQRLAAQCREKMFSHQAKEHTHEVH